MPPSVVIVPGSRQTHFYLDTFLFKFCLMKLSCWMNYLSSWLVILLLPPGKCTLWNMAWLAHTPETMLERHWSPQAGRTIHGHELDVSYRVAYPFCHPQKHRVPDMGWRKKTESKNCPHIWDPFFGGVERRIGHPVVRRWFRIVLPHN